MRKKNKKEILREVITNSSFSGIIPEEFIRSMEEQIDSYSNFFLNFGISAPFIYDVTSNKFLHIDESISDITGLSLSHIQSIDVLEFINLLVTEEHALPISYFATKIYKSFCDKKNAENATINIDYNMKHQSNGKTFRILCQYRPVLWNDQDQPILQIGAFSEISHLSKFGPPRLNIFKNNKLIYQEQSASQHALVKNEFGLTKKELELISLVAKGCKRDEIAKHLSTSIATVYTHRKNIKEKTKKQFPELIRILHERGLI